LLKLVGRLNDRIGAHTVRFNINFLNPARAVIVSRESKFGWVGEAASTAECRRSRTDVVCVYVAILGCA
jgi:hypothetical protein